MAERKQARNKHTDTKPFTRGCKSDKSATETGSLIPVRQGYVWSTTGKG